jgi:hypothetical protein
VCGILLNRANFSKQLPTSITHAAAVAVIIIVLITVVTLTITVPSTVVVAITTKKAVTADKQRTHTKQVSFCTTPSEFFYLKNLCLNSNITIIHKNLLNMRHASK